MGRKTPVHPLALPTVAALTPDHYNIKIIDEEIESINYKLKPDIVGITAMIPNITRAYEIADQYRSLGIPVVMGGAQVSYNVEESLKHADCIVIGEAEDTWPQCLNDFESGKLQSIYATNIRPEFKKSNLPRWDLVDTSKIMALGIQTSRGCPYACEFCLVHNLFGKPQRYRELDNVIEEIKNLPKKQITFVDDNLTANKIYARALMEALKPLSLSWSCQASFDLVDHPDLLNAIAKAGCTSILFGFESINPDSIKEAHKLQNKIERYEEGIHLVQSMGIHVIGSFIVGFDSDALSAFDDIYNFCSRNNLSFIQLNVLMAYPGTNLNERLKKEKRLNPIDPNLLNGIYPTIQFNNMSQTKLYHKYFDTLAKFHDYDHVRKLATAELQNSKFYRDNSADITIRDKFISISHLINKYLLTLNKKKRRMFLNLIGLVRQGITSINVVVEFLLFISSFHGYLRYTKRHGAEILKKIEQYDRGPWANSKQELHNLMTN
ncbi:MAG: B12-binding domain-containing radical SAM protein [Calditrichaceae bacterium]|nr:B12-binding domain-containing radical SAM protein [Calditrichaceae bacterium]